MIIAMEQWKFSYESNQLQINTLHNTMIRTRLLLCHSPARQPLRHWDSSSLFVFRTV